MTLETETLARDGLRIGLGLALTSFAVVGYLWQLLVETNPAWGPIDDTVAGTLFGLGLFLGGVVIAYVSVVRGPSQALADASSTA